LRTQQFCLKRIFHFSVGKLWAHEPVEQIIQYDLLGHSLPLRERLLHQVLATSHQHIEGIKHGGRDQGDLVYLAKLHGEDRVQSDCYLTLAEEKISELVQMTRTTDEAKFGATPDATGKTLHAPTRDHRT
jgi:hypothetical protein